MIDLLACELRREASKKSDLQIEVTVLKADFDFLKRSLAAKHADIQLGMQELVSGVERDMREL